ncbi:MAG: NUDIX hydrolase [Cryomorphaceae bacterium]|nr:NUDIX hydrolase [Cryomorphaceae bacterium]
MNYCSHCGKDVLKQMIPKGDNRKRLVCQNCGTIHYSNPNMVVGCLPVYGDKVLLAKRSIEPRKGFWNLPCGFLENGETVEQGALREVKEETGIDVTLLHLHTVYNLPHAQQVYLIFLAKMTNLDFHPTEESEEVALFPFDQIPWKEMAFSSSAFAIKKYMLDKGKNSETHFGVFYREEK